jgi:hypothetical protein
MAYISFSGRRNKFFQFPVPPPGVDAAPLASALALPPVGAVIVSPASASATPAN